VRAFIVGVAVFVTSPVDAQVADHLQCFSVKDGTNPVVSAFLVKLDATKYPQLPFQPTPECQIKSRPDLFCLNVAKTNVSPAPPGGGPSYPNDSPSFACYRVKGKCDPAQDSFPLAEEDQLRSGPITIKGVRYVCAPSTIGRCDQTALACTGTCPAGEVCSSQFFGACLCVTGDTPCNRSLEFAMCGDGDCPAGQVCKGAFGGCACFQSCGGSFPSCTSENDCAANEHCSDIGGACDCVPNPVPCGGLSQPNCAASTDCPPGTACLASGPTGCACQ
jgi:hypothetical protein